MRPLIPEFNRVVLELAPRFDARPVAPASFAELMALDMAAPMPVRDGASHATVYADPVVNHAFRAWHDAAHRAGGHDFTLEGERATREAQQRAVLAAYPRAPKSWLALLRAEVDAQAEHFTRTGAFPVNQAAFIREQMEERHG